jgi:hypothetical protein
VWWKEEKEEREDEDVGEASPCGPPPTWCRVAIMAADAVQLGNLRRSPTMTWARRGTAKQTPTVYGEQGGIVITDSYKTSMCSTA